MAIAFTARGNFGANADSVVSSSFTPSENSRLFVIGATRSNSSSPPIVSDSVGGTWTLLTGRDITVGNIHRSIYYSDIDESPSVRTVTVTAASSTNTMSELFDVTGHSTDLSNFAHDTDTAGDPSLTLSATAASSLGIAAHIQNAGAGATSSPSGYSSVYGASLATNLRMSLLTDSSSPGTTI